MKYLILFLTLAFVSVSCNKQTCEIGEKYAKRYSQNIADRWKCNYSRVHTDMVSVLNNTVCKDTPVDARTSVAGDMGFLACTAVSAAISKFGGLYLQTKWECDAALVSLDMDKLSNACSLIGLL